MSPTGASIGVKSRIQASGARMTLASELGGEANVAIPEVLDVVHAVEQLDEAVDAEAEREAGVLLGIDADRAEHVGVDHSATPELDPARARTDGAPNALAEDTRHRELC